MEKCIPNNDFNCRTKDLLHLKSSIQSSRPSLGFMLDDSYVGVWHRTFEKGTSLPSSTKVIWFQTHKFFADIRIPNTSRDKQQSFAGHTTIEGNRCQWHQWCSISILLDDTASLELSSDSCEIKEYCDDGGEEIWKKENKKIENIMSLELIDTQSYDNICAKYDDITTQKGFLLVIENEFMRVLSNENENTYESCYGSISKDGSFLISDSTNVSIEGEVFYPNKQMQRFGDIVIERIDDSNVRRWLVHEMKGDFMISGEKT